MRPVQREVRILLDVRRWDHLERHMHRRQESVHGTQQRTGAHQSSRLNELGTVHCKEHRSCCKQRRGEGAVEFPLFRSYGLARQRQASTRTPDYSQECSMSVTVRRTIHFEKIVGAVQLQSHGHPL